MEFTQNVAVVLIIDCDTKYVDGFRHTLESAGVKIVLCPPRVPQCNANAERFVRSIKQACFRVGPVVCHQLVCRTAIPFVLTFWCPKAI